ncbi:hypothetical protein BDZ89DRAFT_1088078 [Hymenopellis radicata]|nr:hypothetical protein BDZ89DRAFT_1088078 [Hymenopellis radicata]
MQAVMPNIISLPYGRCPPLHFMAPNWRHLLKLMARLSGTRVEPTLEALAVIKTDLHLRVVVQFIRPHPASIDWRTVVWFTIDHPVPPSFPGAKKYTTSDVELLPWSYTLSSLPNVLRDSADTPLSKTYTIPATEALPYPKLPISFPNLALYLQAALDESRRYANDSSTHFRKLSRMMDMCYPSLDRMDVGEQSERSKMGGLFKKVIGRGNKSNKSGRRGNEDTYELVTPFVPDEWG